MFVGFVAVDLVIVACVLWTSCRVKKELAWFPKVTFGEGVNEMLNNIKYWKDSPLWNKEKIVRETKTWFKYLG